METNASNQTVISADVQIVGQIKSAGVIQLHGALEGDLNCENDVTIGKGSEIKGNISANAVVVAGTINGNMTARDKIQMQSTAKVFGDIKAKRLSVEDGVTFVGRSEVNPSGSAAAAPPPASSKPVVSGDEPAKASIPGRK